MLNICIIGKGSIGKKHAKIFKKLGHKVSFFRSSIIKNKREIINSKEIYNYKDLSLLNFDLYVICNPTSHHFSSIKKILKKNINILVEKPLVSNFNDLKKLKHYYQKYKISLFVGYVLSHDPRVIFIKNKIKKELKKVKYANFFLQTYMPKWHPKENYKISYAAQKKLGGGVLLTCSHEINLSTFLFGEAKEVFCTYTRSFLKSDVENSVFLIIKHKNNILSNITLDFSSNNVEKRNFHIYLDKISYSWDIKKKSITINNNGNKYFKKIKKSSINNIFNFQNKNIINQINNRKKIKDNFDSLSQTEKIIFAAKKSNQLKKFIKIK